MTTLLKDLYDKDFLVELSTEIFKYDCNFDKNKFIKSLLNDNWNKKELKERMRAIVIAINNYLTPHSLEKRIDILKKTARSIKKGKYSGLRLMIFPNYIEQYCEEKDYLLAMSALEFFTEIASAEFAIRKFIKINQETTLERMLYFSKSDNYHVRRLASEGCRPLLPWGSHLERLKHHPQPIIEILENLKFDSELYVRRSVANNLNDISKNAPDLVIKLLSKWQKENVDEYIIKHSLRTLLKKGNKSALAIMGIKSDEKEKKYEIKDFSLEKKQVSLGQNLIFSFILHNLVPNNKIRLEYGVHFLKKNGHLNKKIFQIATKNFDKGCFKFNKKHLFKDFTTRKHYAGQHFIELIVNGIAVNKTNFDLR
ncbi:MAG: hypothetical protein ISQ34_04150 [Rickettsiales bacterium]|nr:hypothetical protein [Rickettsiales bacterium]